MDEPDPSTEEPRSTEDATTVPPRADGSWSISASPPPTSEQAEDTRSDLHRFARALLEIDLMEQGELDGFLASFAPGQGPANAEQLARVLVQAGKLTPYQAAAVYQGKTKGLIIGKYVVLDKLGAGGMGMVFKATHRRLKRIVALKLLPPSATRDHDLVVRFKREAQLAARLSHPNVVAALDADEYHGVHFLVMEYVEGVDLQKTVVRNGPMALPPAIDAVLQAARGLREAHNHGIIHRDIKPANLLLETGGTVKVLDLGLAKILESTNTLCGPGPGAGAGNGLTRSGMFMGTIDFMAPEQAEDSRGADHRADIYSLGCTLHYLLTGREPYPAETVLKRLLAHQEAAIPSLRTARPEVGPDLDDLYRRMLAKSPSDRPQSMGEVVELLEKCQAAASRPGAPVQAVRVPATQPNLPPTPGASLVGQKVAADSPTPKFELNLQHLLIDVRSDIKDPEPTPDRTSRLQGAQVAAWARHWPIAAVGLLATVAIGIAIFAFANRQREDQNALKTADVEAERGDSERRRADELPPIREALISSTPAKESTETESERSVDTLPAPVSIPGGTSDLAAKPATAAEVPKAAQRLDSPPKTGAMPAVNRGLPQRPSWTLLWGQNGATHGNIPDGMSQKLRELAEQRAVLKLVALSPGGGYVILYGDNQIYARNIDDELTRKLGEFQKKRAEIRFITFTPLGGWVVLTGGHGFAARKIPAAARQQLQELLARGRSLKAITFTPNFGWVILYDKGGVASSNIPSGLNQKLREFSDGGSELKSVAFFPDGNWLILMDWHGWWNSGEPREALDKIDERFKQDVEFKNACVMPLLLPLLSRDDSIARDYVQERMAAHKLPGLSISLINHGKLEWTREYGTARVGSSVPVTRETRFQAGSLSKPVSALAALRLVDQRQVALEQEVNKALVSWKVPDSALSRREKPTLRRLLDHSAGLSIHGFDGYAPGSPLPTLLQILDGQSPANSPPIRVEQLPGDKYRYSSAGYVVLQQMIIDITKKPFPEAMRALVLDPLGMKDSTFEQPLPDDLDSVAASGHREAHVLAGHGRVHPEMAALGLWTTPADLAKFIITVQRAKKNQDPIVRQNLVEEMFRRQKGDAGLGVLLRGKGKSTWFYHNGINAGFECSMIGSAETGQGAVLMTNAAGGLALIEELIPLIEAEYDWAY